jgi:hypothetical protein
MQFDFKFIAKKEKLFVLFVGSAEKLLHWVFEFKEV